MSMNNLTIDGEFCYIVQWFNEWSELQRDDFVPILVKYITGSQINDDDHNNVVESAATPVNMNGLPNELEFNGRPMSLFQCRIKLFNQWNRRWPSEFKNKLQQKIFEIDSKVGEKIKCVVSPNNLGTLLNGYTSTDQDQRNLEQGFEVTNLQPEAETAIVLNDQMTEVLNNETSVDDIETTEDSNVEKTVFNNTQHAEDHDHFTDANVNNDKDFSSNIRHNQTLNEHGEVVEQVVQLQYLQISEENAEKDKNHKDITATVEQKQQQQLPSVTITVNPVIVTQPITTNSEVPLVA